MSNIVAFPLSRTSGFGSDHPPCLEQMADVRAEIEMVYVRLTAVLEELTSISPINPPSEVAAIRPAVS